MRVISRRMIGSPRKRRGIRLIAMRLRLIWLIAMRLRLIWLIAMRLRLIWLIAMRLRLIWLIAMRLRLANSAWRALNPLWNKPLASRC